MQPRARVVTAAATLLCAATLASADVISITPSKDNTLYEDSSGLISNGAGQYLFVGRTGQGAGLDIRRALIAFDITGAIPPGATINSATLTLNMNRTSSGGQTVTVHRATGDWGESTSNAPSQEGGGGTAATGDATWLHAFYNTTFWTTPGGDYAPLATASQTVSGNGNYTWSSAALTSEVQAWLDGATPNYGWVLIGNESVIRTAKRFRSRQSSSNRPTLTVDFTPPANLGACCFIDGACTFETSASCDAAGGVFQGYGTGCVPTPCPEPAGACCFADSTCSELTETNCDAQGGAWNGAFTQCAGVTCPLILEPFQYPLAIPPIAQPITGAPGAAAEYVITMQEVETYIHPDLPPTRVWGYNGHFPGPTIVAARNEPVTVTWVNDLRDEMGVLRQHHYLPVDLCPHGPNMNGDAPLTVVHLHGGHVAPESDGYPEDAFLPGESSPPYWYPNKQEPALLWYHDHGLGITRLNVYMGLAGAYIIRDAAEQALGLPGGQYEVPLIIQDRSFNADGSLKYPAEWHEHFFGDHILVNGRVSPYFNVSRGKYRFRILNGCNSRTLTLSLSNGQSLLQIGTDGGLLEQPLSLTSLTLTPGERADVIIDFGGASPLSEIILQNTAGMATPETPATPNVMKFVATTAAGIDPSIPNNLRDNEELDPNDAVEIRPFELQKFSDPCTGEIWLINGHHWEHISEYPVLGTTEIWEFINRSGDMHPMHMHLVQFQVLNRQDFDLIEGEVVPVGPIIPPDPNEIGWKDTVRADANQIVRVIARFEDFSGRYPYHCHILEHEDHEMMRQFEVIEPCPADMDNSGGVNVIDLLQLLAAWGDCPQPCPPSCAADIDEDCTVNVFDLLDLLSAWGACPPPAR